MEITVKMSPEEYDRFRAYQKEKASIEREIRRELEALRTRHEKLCSKVLNALDAELVSVKDKPAAISALEIADEWFE